MALPCFHEILHLLACPLAIIEILDDGIIATCAGQVRVLSIKWIISYFASCGCRNHITVGVLSLG